MSHVDGPTAVALNHAYVVLDTPTYQAIATDPFMRGAFAPNERRTTVRTDETYTGLYFYGRDTYFELFDVAEAVGRQVGDYALAFGVDEVGTVATLERTLGPELLRPPALITRDCAGRQVPWFWLAALTDFPLRAAQSAWVMEYLPTFLAEWHPRRGRETRGASRRDVLARYRDVLPSHVADAVLGDVVGVTLAATARTRDQLTTFCTAVGYRQRPLTDGGVELVGPDFFVRLVPVASDNRECLTEMQFRTCRTPPGPNQRQLGRSALTLGDGYGALSFRPST